MVERNSVDDLGNSGGVSTMNFEVAGIDYEIDLNVANGKSLLDELEKYRALLDELEKYRAAARVVGGGRGPSRYEAAYQILSDRISDNFDLQWRGPTFALTAQSFLFLGFLAAKSYEIQIALASLIFLVGAAAALLMGRVQCLIGIDQTLLDRYAEKFIDKDKESEYLPHHALNAEDRAAAAGRTLRGRTKFLLNTTPTPTVLWIFTLLALSAGGIYLLVWTLQNQHIL
jgi:hypothetical protein